MSSQDKLPLSEEERDRRSSRLRRILEDLREEASKDPNHHAHLMFKAMHANSVLKQYAGRPLPAPEEVGGPNFLLDLHRGEEACIRLHPHITPESYRVLAEAFGANNPSKVAPPSIEEGRPGEGITPCQGLPEDEANHPV